jgi:hypothetical protein
VISHDGGDRKASASRLIVRIEAPCCVPNRCCRRIVRIWLGDKPAATQARRSLKPNARNRRSIRANISPRSDADRLAKGKYSSDINTAYFNFWDIYTTSTQHDKRR